MTNFINNPISHFMKIPLIASSLLTASASAVTLSFTSNPGAAIPDGSSSGVSDQIVVVGNPDAILSLTVEVEISSPSSAFLGGWNASFGPLKSTGQDHGKHSWIR